MSRRALTFPLLPRRRVTGAGFGAMRSRRFGTGFDLAGSRPYAPGDDVRQIDWRASARVSSARDSDEFFVREHLAERTGRLVILADRSARMAVSPDGLPWLSKPDVVSEAGAIIIDSGFETGCAVGYLDGAVAADEAPFWRPPSNRFGHRPVLQDALGRHRVPAPNDTAERLLRWLTHPAQALTPGTFVFVLSDFLRAPSDDAWIEALARGLDPVPVVIQDPVWEQSFPDVAGAVLPIANPASGRLHLTRFSRAEVRTRRRENEERLTALLRGFDRVGISPVILSSSDQGAILAAFRAWVDTRRLGARLAR